MANPYEQFLTQEPENPYDQFVNPKPPEPRGILRAAGDTALQFGKGAVSGVRMLSDVFGADNAVSDGLRNATEALDGLLSASAQQDQRRVAEIMQEAEGKGWGEQIVIGLRAAGVAPGALLAQGLGTMAPTVAASLIPGVGPAAIASRIGSAGIGAAQGIGSIKGSIYETTKQELIKAGATEAEAEARAVQAQEYGGENSGQIALGGALGAVAGSTGAERAVSALRNGITKSPAGIVGRMAQTGVVEAVPEFAQGGQEKYATNTALANEGFDVDPMSGVVAGATMEGLAGFGLGAGFGIKAPRVNDLNPPTDTKPADPLLLGNTPDPLIGFPDGTVGRRSDVDAYVNNLPEDQRVAARAKLMGLGAKDILAAPDADSAIATFNASLTGTDMGGILGQANPLIAPAREMQAQAAADQADLADLAQTETRDLNTLRAQLDQESRKQADLDALQATGTGQFGIRPEERAAVEQAATVEAPTAMQLAMQEARALAQSPSNTPLGNAPNIELPPPQMSGPDGTSQRKQSGIGGQFPQAGSLNTDVAPTPALGVVRPTSNQSSLNDKPTTGTRLDGAPFKTLNGAEIRIKANGQTETHEIVQIEGGYVVRPKTTQADAAPTATDAPAGVQPAASGAVVSPDAAQPVPGTLTQADAAPDQAGVPDGYKRIAGYERYNGPQPINPTSTQENPLAQSPETVEGSTERPEPATAAAPSPEGVAVDQPATGAPLEAVAQGAAPQAVDPRLIQVSKRAPSEPKPIDQRLVPVSQRPAATEAPKPDQGAEVSRYNGKFGKGMGKDAAKLEAARLNRADPTVTYTAEEHDDPKLENPWAVVGRKVVEANQKGDLEALTKAQQAAGEEFSDATPQAHRAEADRIAKVAQGMDKFPDIKRRYEALAESHRMAAERKDAEKTAAKPDDAAATPATQATTILDAANVTGKDRLDILKDVKTGALTPDEVQAAFPDAKPAEPDASLNNDQLMQKYRAKGFRHLVSVSLGDAAEALNLAMASAQKTWTKTEAGYVRHSGENKNKTAESLNRARLASPGARDWLDHHSIDGEVIAESPAKAYAWAMDQLKAMDSTQEPVTPANTENAGAELTYNKRNRVKTGIKWSDIADKDVALRVSETTKANASPKPDYQALVDGGMQPLVAHMVKQAYDSLAAAPNTGTRAPTDADLKGYIEGIQRYMAGVVAWANNSDQTRAWIGSMGRRAGVMAGAASGMPTSLSDMAQPATASLYETVYPGGWRTREAELRLIGGNKALQGLQPSTDHAMKATKDIGKGWPAKQEAWQKQGYSIVSGDEFAFETYVGKDHNKEPYVTVSVRMKKDGRSIDLMQRTFDGATSKDNPAVQEWGEGQIEALKGKQLLLGKYNRLQGTFDTLDAAKEKARELTKRDGKTTVSDKGISVESAEREGVQHRMEGEDISSDRLKDAFGLKGVNFGNWMLGDSNAKERQMHLNHAYDSFMDLAGVLGVPPKALSLNGMLGLAIGAQGTGQYAAHFVPGVNEINLTRTSGAGSLAHEFGHGLDHYFARIAGLTRMSEPFLTEFATQPAVSDRVVDGKNVKINTFGDLRPEIVEAFKAIVRAMNKRPTTEAETALKRQESLKKAERNVTGWMASIRADFERLTATGVTRNNKKEDAPADLMEKFDAMAARVNALDLGDGKAMAGDLAMSQPVSDMRDLYKSVTGRVYSLDQIKGLQFNIDHLKYLTDAKASTAEHVPQMVTTDYATAAAKLDKDKGGKRYWSTDLEKFARAFDAFISDKLEAAAAKNTYLSHAGRSGETVPMGAEREAINAGIQKLVDTIQTKEDDAGNVAMFARAEGGGEYSVLDDPSAEEADAVQAGIEGKSAAQAADFIANNAPDESHRLIAARVAVRLRQLESAGSKFTLHIAHVGGQIPITMGGSGVRGQTIQRPNDPETQIWIQGADAPAGKIGTSYETVLHELVHAATQKAIDLGQHGAKGEIGIATKELAAVWGGVVDHLNKKIAGGETLSDFERNFEIGANNTLENPHELVTWALTNKEMQAYLESIPYKKSTLWGEFVSAVRRFLGLPVNAETALSQVLHVSDKLLSIDVSELKAAASAQWQHMQTNLPGSRGIVNSSQPAFGTQLARGPITEQQRISVQRVQSIVNASKIKADVQVVATPADLPVEAPADARGLYYNGAIYVVASNNRTAADVHRTIAHEAIGHHGLREMLGRDGWKQMMAQIQLGIKAGNKGLKSISDYVRRTYVDKDGEFNLNANQEADEIAAKAVEDGVDPVTGEFKPGFGFLKSVFAKVARFLRDMGIPVQFTNMELQGMLVQAQANLQRDSSPVSNRNTPAMAARADKFPVAGRSVDGRYVRDRTPNEGSISASFTKYTVLPGIREVSMDDMDQGYIDDVRGADLDDRTQRLADEIEESDELNPLIVAIDAKGAYILEGGHRYDALIKLGAKSFPAKVVYDNDDSTSAMFSRKGSQTDSAFARGVVTGGAIPQAWQAPDPSKMDDFLYTMQDKHIDTKRVVTAVRDAIGGIADNLDPYLQEELYHGRAAKSTKDFLEQSIRPLMVDIQARGVEMSDFEEYLHNRHAERRNVQVAKVNPNMLDGGSGIKTADARAYLAGLPAAKRTAYQALAKRIDQMNRETRALLVSSGLEKQSTIDAWDAAYGDEYVPLMREEMDNGAMGIGQGFSVRGGASKRAMGSDKPVANILANIALQREKAITRAEKRKIGEALYGMVLSAPNPDFWIAVDPALQQNPAQITATAMQLISMGMNPVDAQQIAAEPTQRYIDPRTGQVANRINPALRSADNVLAVRIDGEDKYVFFNEKDERAMRMAKALKNLDSDQLGLVMGNVAKVTRYFAAVNTQFNPVFGVVNLTRDIQTALLNLQSTALKGKQADVMKHVGSALRGIYIDLRDHRAGKTPTSAWASLFEEFQREGGATGFRDMYANAQERADAIADELKKIKQGKAMAVGRGISGWLSDYNESMENAVRVAAYKVGKEQGLSNQQAASLAKNLTVNFNRKGQVALQAGALYAFFNAAVQGSARLSQTMFEPGKVGKLSGLGKKIMAGGLLLGSMQALLLAAAGFDDEEPPDFVRERALVLPIGGDKYISIPMPLGFHVLPSLARIPTEWAMGGFKDTPKRIGQLVGLFADAFNPIGSAGLSLQTLAPTIIDPLAALAENRDWTGKPIAKKDFNSMQPTAGHLRAKDTATPWARAISYGVNWVTGGTDYKPGLASPTPDQIDYLIGQATGGVGREVSKLSQVAGSTVSGEELPLYKIPLLGRFVGTTAGQAAESGRFYANLKEIGEHDAELTGLKKDRRMAEYQEYVRDNPQARLVPIAERTYREVSKLNRAKRDALKNGASKDRIKLIDQQITQRMKIFNDRVKATETRETATQE